MSEKKIKDAEIEEVNNEKEETKVLSRIDEQHNVLSEAFAWLCGGLLLAFIVSYTATLNEDIIRLVYGSLGGYSYFIFVILELVLAIVFQVRIKKMSPTTAKIMYLLYSALTGLTLSGIFLVYTKASIIYVFLATAICFGTFALIGKYSKADLTKWGIYLFFALIAIIILEIINIFVMNNTLNMILCIVGVLIFCAYTAYDVKRALDKSFLADVKNKGIYCAFQLFLDFINLFIDLLRLFGKSRD